MLSSCLAAFCFLVRTPKNTLYEPNVFPELEGTEADEADTVGVAIGLATSTIHRTKRCCDGPPRDGAFE